MSMQQGEPLLSVRDLCQYFRLGRKVVKAVDGVSFDIYPGETFALVGESGSGKSTAGRAVIRLYEPTGGSVLFRGREIGGRMSAGDRRALRTGMQMIFQDPMASLNPRRRVLDSIAQGLDIHGLCHSREERRERVLRMMDRVGLNRELAERYPHQFSGGQRQRVGIARALVLQPDLVIADEALSALDMSIQAQVVNLMKDIQDETGTAYLFIAHDLSMVRYLARRIGVLHRGRLVETGTSDEIFESPVHPYTRGLLSAIPKADPRLERDREPLLYDGEQSGIDYSTGAYHHITDTHCVLAADTDLRAWTAAGGLAIEKG